MGQNLMFRSQQTALANQLVLITNTLTTADELTPETVEQAIGQLEELEVGVSHLAEQGEHERALAFFGSEVVCAGRFRHPARLAPDVQLPGDAGVNGSGRQGIANGGGLDHVAAGVVGALAEGAGIIRPREERGFRDGDVLAGLFHARHGGLQVTVVLVGIRQEVLEILVLENFPPGQVRNGLRGRGGSSERRGHGHVHRLEVGTHHAGGSRDGRAQQDGACDVLVRSHNGVLSVFKWFQGRFLPFQ